MTEKGRVRDALQDGGDCLGCGLRDLVLFADLTEADIDLIHLPIAALELDAGTVLYRQGDMAGSLFTLRTGLVKLVRRLPDGGQRIVRLLEPGATIGLEASLGDSYEHEAVALRPSSLCRIPRAVIAEMMNRSGHLNLQLLKRWHGAVRDADLGLAELSVGKASHRLARLLLRFAAEDGTAPLFGREDLGALLGITMEHASRSIAALKRVGVIVAQGQGVCRVDLDSLRRFAGG